MRPASRRLLAEVIAETVVPYCLARPETVSPVRTTWVRAAVLPDEARLAPPEALTALVAPGMVSRWPMTMRARESSRVAATISAAGVPLRFAGAGAVAAASAVCVVVVVVGRGAAVRAPLPAADGRRSTWPTLIRASGPRLFAATIAATLVPVRAAMALTVSPARTR